VGVLVSVKVRGKKSTELLETLGLRVDPTTGKIEKTEFYMLYV